MTISITEQVEKLVSDYIQAENILLYYEESCNSRLSNKDIEAIISSFLESYLPGIISDVEIKANEAEYNNSLEPYFEKRTGYVTYRPRGYTKGWDAYDWADYSASLESYPELTQEEYAKRKEWYQAYYKEMQEECDNITEWERLLASKKSLYGPSTEGMKKAREAAETAWLLSHNDLEDTKRHIYYPGDEP